MLHVKLTRLLCSLVNLPGALMDLAASDVTWRHRPRTITRVCTAPIASITRTWAAITADNEDERKIFNNYHHKIPTNQPTNSPPHQSVKSVHYKPTHPHVHIYRSPAATAAAPTFNNQPPKRTDFETLHRPPHPPQPSTFPRPHIDNDDYWFNYTFNLI